MEEFILQFSYRFLNASLFTHFASFLPWLFIRKWIKLFAIHVLITNVIHNENNEDRDVIDYKKASKVVAVRMFRVAGVIHINIYIHVSRNLMSLL